MRSRCLRPLAPCLFTLSLFTLSAVGLAADAAEPGWSTSFPSGDVHSFVHAAAVFDEDGSGGKPAVLFAGGDFSSAGGLDTENIARWDGERWSPVGLGCNGPVHALCVFDPDGAGPESAVLVAGGEFTIAGGQRALRIAAWDGTQWSGLTTGLGEEGSSVRALHAWDPDGPGDENAVLVVGGHFLRAGDQSVGGLATWNGSAWGNLGPGTTDAVYAIAGFGTDLWVGGNFDDFNGEPIPHFARFDGLAWASGGRVIPAGAEVRTLTVWNDGGGERLAIGGNFDVIDGVVTRNVAAFDGGSFQALGAGVGTFNHFVEVLAAFDPDGSDETLWAGGDFGTGSMRCLARYDGVAWSGVGEIGLWPWDPWVYALVPFDADGTGPNARRLWVGGRFSNVDDVATSLSACEWDGARLVPLGNGLIGNLRGAASFDPDGTGPEPALLYVFGYSFRWAGEYQPQTASVAAWNGSEWTDPGFTANGRVLDMKSIDLGDGPELYVTGDFTEIGGISATRIAKWDGVAWSALGSGTNVPVLDLEAWDPDGAGSAAPVLVAAGDTLYVAGGVSVDRVAQWDGNAWSDLGGGALGGYGVRALEVYDEPGAESPKLFAARNTRVTCANHPWLYRLDDLGWVSLGTGYGFWLPDLEAYDPDGAGPEPEQLYLPVSHHCYYQWDAPGQVLARWNGVSFEDTGFPHLAEPAALEAVDLDGAGPENEVLFADNVTGPDEVSRWDGSNWSVVAISTKPASGLYGPFSDLVEHDPDGPGPATPLLVVVGDFRSLQTATGDIVSSGNIGLYGYDPDAATSVTIDLPAASGAAPTLSAGHVRPTPSRGAVGVSFSLAREGVIRAMVYDVQGRRVRRLLDEVFPAGTHQVQWDGADGKGRGVTSGVYFLNLEAHGESITRRVVRIQ